MLATRSRRLAVGAAALVLLTACTFGSDPGSTSNGGPSSGVSASVPAGLERYYGQQVRWERCGGRFQCTKVTVPLDYEEPSEPIELKAIRLRARNSRGSILYNPGGPGVSPEDYVRSTRSIFTRNVIGRFDIVGVDPRGVVGSTPVECVSDAQLDEIFAADGTPDDPGEVAELERLSALIGPGCKAKTPDIAAHMDTVSAARDMDIVRAVLGDDRLNLLGKSYATFLGATYAELFPERVGRMVLDGALPSSVDSDELALGQAKAFDVALRRFVADCITVEDCPLPRDVDAGVARIQQFIEDLDATPLPGTGDRMLTQALGTYAILSYLYMPPMDWADLRYGLEVAFTGDGSELMFMMDLRTQRNQDGTYADNSNEAFYAISCLDRPALGGADHAEELSEAWASQAPVFGPYLAWGSLPCWEWPVGPGAVEPEVIRAEGSAPILVVSTKYDPATPYEWGVQVAGELANATLLTYDGDGHTAYTTGSSCVDAAVDAYLLEGTLPAEGTVCAPDAQAEGTAA